ncbi:MAG: response regulator [Phycisphaeraceae bacterium]|nr:response regulator [Phycisphaeraceae bacterium]
MNARQGPIDTLRSRGRDPKHQPAKVARARAKTADKPDVQRRRLRLEYPSKQIIVEITQPLGSRVSFRVMPQDISAHGIGFFHARFVHKNSLCEVMLPTLDGEMYLARGRVVDCIHVNGTLHRVAVCFEHPIELDQFVPLTAVQMQQASEEMRQYQQEQAAQSGADPLNQLIGRAIVVDDLAVDRRLFVAWLSGIGLEVQEIEDGETARKAVEEGVDLVILDMHLHGADGVELTKTLRGMGYSGPIIGVSADESPEMQAKALEAGCNNFLTKPFESSALVNAVLQLLQPLNIGGTEDGWIHSSLASDPAMKPLIKEFVTGLIALQKNLTDAVRTDNKEKMSEICYQLKGVGTSYGFEAVTQLARVAIAKLNDTTADPAAIRTSVSQLVQLLHRLSPD